MSIVQLQVGPLVGPDGNPVSSRAGKGGEQIVSELHGKYAEQTYRGRVFFGVSAVGGIALIAPAAGGGHPTLWNPVGSNFNANLIRLQMSYVSGANAPGAIEWALTQQAGAAIGTGAPIVTFTNVPPTSALIGGGSVSQMKWAPTVNTFTAAPAFLMPTGLALDTMAAASTNAPWQMMVDYDGSLILAPGNALSLCFQAATTTALFQIALFWEEVPV